MKQPSWWAVLSAHFGCVVCTMGTPPDVMRGLPPEIVEGPFTTREEALAVLRERSPLHTTKASEDVVAQLDAWIRGVVTDEPAAILKRARDEIARQRALKCGSPPEAK